MSAQKDSAAAALDCSWRNLCVIGGTTALLAVALVPAEVVIGFLPGVEDKVARTVTVIDWFTLFQNHAFLALRNLGLLNIVGVVLLIPTMLAIYSVLKRDGEAYAALGTILFFVGITVYLAGSRAFPMLFLSHQYASAATEAQRSMLTMAGQVMLVQGESRAGILLIEFACLVISLVMLRGKVFSKGTGWAGVLGNSLMMLLEIAFMPPHGVGMAVAAGGGLSIMTWYFLTGRRLLQVRRVSTADRG